MGRMLGLGHRAPAWLRTLEPLLVVAGDARLWLAGSASAQSAPPAVSGGRAPEEIREPPRVQIPGAAHSSAIAEAVRRHGDALPVAGSSWRSLVSGAYVAVALAYVGWMLASLDLTRLWIAIPFAAANLLTLTYGLLLVVNGWRREVPVHRPLPHGAEPFVAVLVPTCGEPIPMILRTVESVLQQDWPLDRMVVVVSDDGHDPKLEEAVRSLGMREVDYYSPLPRYAAGRDGAAKAGNLNAALAYVCDRHPEAEVIETRDADDEMGSLSFLREVVGQLHADPGLAFVQTIKEASVTARDPFNNRETLFYRGQMLSKNAANAVFPCGSGVVWRRDALHSIGDFPTWNLVEDLQSGVEALRRKWRGMYLPIVGAVAQHAPEDLPSVFKQRGTWATDSVRLMTWARLKGLTLRQRMHFWEIALCYLNSFTTPVYVASLLFCLVTGAGPLEFTPWACALFMGSLVVVSELWLAVSFYPYNDRRRRQRGYLRSLWRARVVWNGLAPAYMVGAFKALAGGPHRKPVYRVTRKTHDHRFHWRFVVPHAAAVVALVAASVYAVVAGSMSTSVVPSLYWSGLVLALLVNFISLSWFALPGPAGRPSFTPRLRALSGALAARLAFGDAPATRHGLGWAAVRVVTAVSFVGVVALLGLPYYPQSEASGGMHALSTTHRIGTPAESPLIRMAWAARTDAEGYSVSWSRRWSEPDAVRDLAGSVAGVVSPPLAPGRWWFNLRSEAGAEWTSTVHAGPFVVAGSAVEVPLIPGSAHGALRGYGSPRGEAGNGMHAFSTSHRIGTPAASPLIGMAWTPRPGVEGYSIRWSRRPSEPDAVRDIGVAVAGVVSPPLAPGRWWFNLRADTGESWTPAAHVGPFVVAGSGGRGTADPGNGARPLVTSLRPASDPERHPRSVGSH